MEIQGSPAKVLRELRGHLSELRPSRRIVFIPPDVFDQGDTMAVQFALTANGMSHELKVDIALREDLDNREQRIDWLLAIVAHGLAVTINEFMLDQLRNELRARHGKILALRSTRNHTFARALGPGLEQPRITQ